VAWLYAYLSLQIGECAAHFQDSIVGTRRQPQPGDRVLEKPFRLRIDRAVRPNQPRRHLRVAEDSLAGEALQLNPSRPYNPFADLRRALRRSVASQLLELHRGHVDVNIYPIEQRT